METLDKYLQWYNNKRIVTIQEGVGSILEPNQPEARKERQR